MKTRVFAISIGMVTVLLAGATSSKVSLKVSTAVAQSIVNEQTQENRFIKAEDLYDLQLISGCEISPDGCNTVYCVQRIDKETEKKYSNLWIVPTIGMGARQFTYGDQVDSQPKWSPDGSRIAFLSNRGDEHQSQLYIIPFHGGEARQLTKLKGAINSFEWSPDGKQFVCQFRKKDKEAIELKKNELGIVSHHITRVFYKLDGVGFLPEERSHIWTINADTGESKQLTDSDVYDELAPSWAPDGKVIVFYSNRSKEPDLDPDTADLFLIPAEGGRFHKVGTAFGTTLMNHDPTFSPDGKWLAYYGMEKKYQEYDNYGLWVVPVDGGSKAKNLTDKFDFCVGTGTINDLIDIPEMMPPTWSKDSSRLYFQVIYHGDSVLKSIALDGSEEDLQTVIGDKGVIGAFSFDKEQSKLAYYHADMTDPGQIWLFDMTTGSSRKLTNVNENLLQARDFGEVEEVWFKSPSGNDLHGWILKPPGFDESKKYPSVLEIHGGPMLQYGNFFMHEFYYLAANGYVVYFCNPRGSQGYGQEHCRAIWNNWGTVDYDDVMTWADFIKQKSYIDPKRMGVTGGSYGGYMTNWIIGHTDRFTAAVTQRSISNMISLYGSNYFNWTLQHTIGNKKPPWELFDHYWNQSPIKYIGNAKTPTLVIHSEQDLICPIEQGEQVFVALKRLGVDTEMVVFLDEPHGLSREGRTDRRIERLRHILRWFDLYLKK